MYAPWKQLPTQPVADSSKPVRQFLSDMTGDGRLDWIVAQPGYSGFFSLNHDRSWSGFTPFNALPLEFFNPEGQLADLMGDGLRDLAMIGSRSVRLYASGREQGFHPACDIAHAEDPLPLGSDSRHELVAFSDVLGSGQQHLIRIRHDELRCWPNLGRGVFGKSFKLASLPFAQSEFDAARVRLADLDGSGAADLVYLGSEQALIFLNQGGNGLAEPVTQAWPEGLRYDNTWQVSVADLQGLGCTSLVISVPHRHGQHWRLTSTTAANRIFWRVRTTTWAPKPRRSTAARHWNGWMKRPKCLHVARLRCASCRSLCMWWCARCNTTKSPATP